MEPRLIQAPDDLFRSPNMVEEKPGEEYKEVDELFCDSSGFGQEFERALTKEQATRKIKELMEEHGTIYTAVTAAGQFQVYVTVYVKEAV